VGATWTVTGHRDAGAAGSAKCGRSIARFAAKVSTPNLALDDFHRAFRESLNKCPPVLLGQDPVIQGHDNSCVGFGAN